VETVARGGLNEFTESTLVETIIGSIYTMSRFLVGNQEPIIVRWQYPACQALSAPFATHNTEIRFNQLVNSISMRYQVTEKRLALADEHARLQSIAMCEQEMQEMIKHTSLRHRIYTQLLSCAQGMPTVEMIADQLHLSTRTVHRRLKQEGTCFRDLINDARMVLAKQYLLRDQLTITEVAFKLGYGDSANFTRAFKRIEGMTPTEFIQQSTIRNDTTQ
jgi:AraC-like DNA-binding protein